jgi:acyl-CoA thioester hydrolase
MPIQTVLPVQIRFCDVDALGHVNTAVYLSYFELARMDLFRKAGLTIDWSTIGIILARIEIDYLLPLKMNDEIQIECKSGKTGYKSFELHYEIMRWKEDRKEIVCRGKSVQVCFDYSKHCSVPLPDSWKHVLAG